MRRPRRRRRELLSNRVRDGRGDQFVAGVVRVHAVVVKLGVDVTMHVIEIREVRINENSVVIRRNTLNEGRHLHVQDVDVRPLPRWVLGRDGRRHEHDGFLVRGVPQLLQNVLVGVREVVGPEERPDGVVAARLRVVRA